MNISSIYRCTPALLLEGGKHWRGAQSGWLYRNTEKEGVGGQWQRQRPILRLAAGGSVNESRAGHMWVGRRDSPAAETDAMVVKLNFFCQAPTSSGQKQTLMLGAPSVSLCVRCCCF